MSTHIEPTLDNIRSTIHRCFFQSSLAPLLDDPSTLLANPGKMLRSRLLAHLGKATGLSDTVLIPAAAAVELLHTASLLHDDIIDNATLRRNAPSFWSHNGTAGAVLLGDLLILYAMRLLVPLNNPRISNALIRFAGEVAEAEVEQEIIRRGQPQSADECIATARHKTGPFFAFMGFVAGGENGPLCESLTEACYLAGTSYQLADDMLDAYGSKNASDKSLNRDSLRSKSTAAIAFRQAGLDASQVIGDMLHHAEELLNDFPLAQDAFAVYLRNDLKPAITTCLSNSLSG
jgi:geranylgeranyl pyrophosphate synthase